jgi:hypothetical protein
MIRETSVADLGCLSRILIFTHPRSRIQKQQQKRGVKKISCHPFFWSHTFHKIVNYFIFEMLKKKIWPNFQRILELFTQKLSLSSQKYGFGIRDPGSMGQKEVTGPGSGSATLRKT